MLQCINEDCAVPSQECRRFFPDLMHRVWHRTGGVGIVRRMTKPKGRHGGNASDIEDLARRFQDLWREQLTAMAADPEFVEMMGKWMGAAGGAGPFGLPPTLPGAVAGTGGATAFGGFDNAAWLAALGEGPPAAARGRMEQTDDQTAAGRRGPSQAGPAAASASSRAGRVAGDELERRIADLERRLDRLEAALGAAGRKSPGRARKSRS